MSDVAIVVSRDEHRLYYLSIRDFLVEQDASEGEIEECEAAGTVWCVQVYPDTPVGFRRGIGATLAAAMERAGAIGLSEEER